MRSSGLLPLVDYLVGTNISKDTAFSIVVQKEEFFLDCPEDGGSKVSRDADCCIQIETVSYPRRPEYFLRLVLDLVTTKLDQL